MKSLLFKSIFVLVLALGIAETSSAYGGYYRGRFCAPRYYCGARYVPAPRYYAPVFVPGHWAISPWGVRIWVGPCYR